MDSRWWVERLFDDPGLERRRRAAACALLLSLAHTRAELSQHEQCEEYLTRLALRRAKWGVTWEEVTAIAGTGDIEWWLARRLQPGGGA
jgi:hypothetical protein